MIRILLADNQAIFRSGMARVLSSQSDMIVLGQCGAPDELLSLIAPARNAILLLAASLDADIDRTFAAASANGVRIILLHDNGNEPEAIIVRKMDGLLSRHVSTDDLLHCVRRVFNGERAVKAPVAEADDSAGRRIRDALTTRELQIVGFIVQGWKNRQIAEEIGTKEQVVKNYLRSIYDKTGASDRLELALFTLHHRPLAEAAAKAVTPTSALSV
ncbi:response regulator transcription factor [Terriglobus roseus]|uniref:DNA-binding response regulator, NarL/FixJ family, contains REC and HTH domains n=1 Tax=Terriglobus roseus TaxID=392734 RepID=A0A1G7H3Z0_9BACT|nr:response regulator transcription factor [Terriglobus roseus]SDE95126.1 DNA-binding response regulator, NarL/FixJ family, contains REC and HTH domains [Terriglobus roseus]